MAVNHPLKIGTKVYFEWPKEEAGPDYFSGDGFDGLAAKGRIVAIESDPEEGYLGYDVKLTWFEGPESKQFEIDEVVCVRSVHIRRVVPD